MGKRITKDDLVFCPFNNSSIHFDLLRIAKNQTLSSNSYISYQDTGGSLVYNGQKLALGMLFGYSVG